MKNAFNSILKLKQKKLMIARVGEFPETDIYMGPSNYFRNMQGPEDMVIKGREFVVSESELDRISFPGPIRRGDVVIDPDFGSMRVDESREMYGLSGEILGYRIRVS